MGPCASQQKKKQRHSASNSTQKADDSLPLEMSSKEKQYLSLLYWDLANRSKMKTLDHHHFALFFELTGLWGDKLFRSFATHGKHDIALTDFLKGIGKIVRAPFDQKTRILFNFIKNPDDDGIKYKQFLKMVHLPIFQLYHYSKPELKEIMTNDGVFVHEAIIPSSKHLLREKQCEEVIELIHQPSVGKIEEQPNSHYLSTFQKTSKGYKDPGTLIKFQTQKVLYQISFCNMSLLTKQYASHIFCKYNINEEKGKMNISQFSNYLETNRKLFDTYYAVFHEKLWGWKENKPLFLEHIEKQSKIFYMESGKKKEGYLMLAIHTLIISSSDVDKDDVLKMIYLVGVEVSDEGNKKILIKDEPQGNNMTEIQFQTEDEVKEWLIQLKPYLTNYFKNKYEILQSIGTGRFSIVYRCRQRKTQKQYALKVLEWKKLTAREQAAIQNQSQVMKVLKSPQFSKQYETILTKNNVYIVSQYIFGQDLFEYVRRKKRLNQSEAVFIMRLLIQAVMHLHGIQIIHRDLKPENIMVVYSRNQLRSGDCSPLIHPQPKPQQIKIIDFGFANYLSALQEQKQCTAQKYTETPIGTLGYMAPQILLGEKPSFQNDTFSVGCIILRGKYPFQSANPEGTAIMTVKGEYSLYDSVWDEISDEGKELVQMFLETDPELRITLKDALSHAWFENAQEQQNGRN